MRSFLATRAALLTTIGLLAISANQTALMGQPLGSGAITERFLGLFRSGEQTMEIKPSGKEGELRVSITGGPSTTELLGHVSQDGKLHATGKHRFCTLLGGCDGFMCNLVAEVNSTRLTGAYECIQVERHNTIIGQMDRKYGEGPRNINFQKFVPEHTSR